MINNVILQLGILLVSGYAVTIILKRILIILNIIVKSVDLSNKNTNLQRNTILAYVTFASILLNIGIASFLNTSIIFSSMVVGVTVVNFSRATKYKKSDYFLTMFTSPFLLVFFVLTGTKVIFSDFSSFQFYPGVAYFIARGIGKLVGINLSGRLINLHTLIGKNLGLGLQTQGRVTLGLVISANNVLSEVGEEQLGRFVVIIIIFSVFLSTLFGSFSIRFGLIRSGESELSAKIRSNERRLLTPNSQEELKKED